MANLGGLNMYNETLKRNGLILSYRLPMRSARRRAPQILFCGSHIIQTASYQREAPAGTPRAPQSAAAARMVKRDGSTRPSRLTAMFKYLV